MAKNKNVEQSYVRMMLQEGLFAVVFPEDKSEVSAQKIVDAEESAVGIVKFENENNETVYGVLIDKIIEARRHFEQNSAKKAET